MEPETTYPTTHSPNGKAALSAITHLRHLAPEAPHSASNDDAKSVGVLDTLRPLAAITATASHTGGASPPSLCASDASRVDNLAQHSTLEHLDEGVHQLICSNSRLQDEVDIVQAWHDLRTSDLPGLRWRRLPGNPKWSNYDVDRIRNAFVKAVFTARCDSVLPSRAGILLEQAHRTPSVLPETMTTNAIINVKDGLSALQGGRPPTAFMSKTASGSMITESLKQWRDGRESEPPEADPASTHPHIIDMYLDETITMCESLQAARDWVEMTVAKPSQA